MIRSETDTVRADENTINPNDLRHRTGAIWARCREAERRLITIYQGRIATLGDETLIKAIERIKASNIKLLADVVDASESTVDGLSGRVATVFDEMALLEKHILVREGKRDKGRDPPLPEMVERYETPPAEVSPRSEIPADTNKGTLADGNKGTRGRPRSEMTKADRQRAYRQRKKDDGGADV